MTSPTLAADQALEEFRAAVKAHKAFGPIDVVASAALGASFRDTRPSAGSAPRRSSSGARAEPPGSVAGSRLCRACVLIVEDIIAAGLSSRESWRALAEPDALPPDLAALPPVKPGSRPVAGAA